MSSALAAVLSNPVPTAGAVVGTIKVPFPPTVGSGEAMTASEVNRPIPIRFELVTVPTARQVKSISSSNGTFALTTIFRFIAPVSYATMVPDGPVRTSNRAVPGVVTAHEIRPCNLIFNILPINQKLFGKIIRLAVGMQLAADAAVSAGPSVEPMTSGTKLLGLGYAMIIPLMLTVRYTSETYTLQYRQP